MKAKITDGKFEIRGQIESPQGVYISIDDRYYSPLYIISEGQQYMKIDVARNEEFEAVSNKYTDEQALFNEYFVESRRIRQDYYAVRDSFERQGVLSDEQLLYLDNALNSSYLFHDSTLQTYVQENPASQSGFWNFAYLTNFGYSPIFDAIFNSFDDTIRKSFAGRRLGEHLMVLGRLAEGKTMPHLKAIDSLNNSTPENIYETNEYTLVDFWYSSCGPCITQFPELKKLYLDFSGAGFDIVGISTDKRQALPAWQTMLKKFELPWQQFIDVDGVFAASLGIMAYPSTYLVDKHGKIVLSNAKPIAIREFLKRNLM